MQFPEIVASLARSADVAHAQQAIRSAHGRGASRWLAEQADISPRTARRWLSGNYPRGRARAILGAAGDIGAAAVAAQRLAAANSIDVGKVRVAYRGNARDEGARRIGQIRVGGEAATSLADAAAALQAGKLDYAADAFSDAVVSGYEPGLEEALAISDYSDGIDLAE